MSTSKLIKNSSIYVFVEVLNKGLPFFLLPVFTRYIGAEGYGYLSLFIAIVNIAVIFIGIGIQGSINANFYRLSKTSLAEYTFNAIIVISCIALISTAIVFFFRNFIPSEVQVDFSWLLIGIIISFFKVIQMIYLSLLKMNSKAVRYGLFQLVNTALDAFFTIVIIVCFLKGWQGRVTIMLIIAAIFSLYAIIDIMRLNYIKFQIRKEYIKDMLNFGLPLLPHQFSIWLRTGADRFIVTSLISASAVGIYSAGYQLGFGLSIVVLAFSQAYQPLLYKEITFQIDKDKKRKIVIRTYIIFIIIIIFATLIGLFLPLIIPAFLGNQAFNESIELIPWFAAASAFQGMYLVVVLFILHSKKTHLLSLVTIISGIIHLLLSIYLTKKNGILGPAQASIVSYLLAFILTWWLSNKIYPLPWFEKLIINNTNDARSVT